MRIQIDAIKINPGRRELSLEHIEELAKSIAELGLLNPITVDQEHTLIAGLHRLEAVKKLGWTEIEATISSLEGLQAELAEIDENFVRCNLSTVEYGELLLRRKEIYEMIHPDVVQTNLGGPFRGNQYQEVSDKMSLTSKSFARDTADKLGVGKRTVERQIQTAKNLTAGARDILRHSDISKKDALKLSRLTPEQQEEAAHLLVSGQIKSIGEYTPKAGVEAVDAGPETDCPMPNKRQSIPDTVPDRHASPDNHPQPEGTPMKENHHTESDKAPVQQKRHPNRAKKAETASASSAEHQNLPQDGGIPTAPPYSLGRKRYATIKESVADLKDPNKDCSCTPDSFLAEIDAFVQKFKQEIEWFHIPYYDPALPGLTQVQLDFFLRQMDLICDAAHNLTTHVKEGWSNRGQEA